MGDDATNKSRSWRDDKFARHETQKSGRLVEGLILVAVLAVMGYFALTLKPSSQDEVIVYTSQDQVYAEPIFRDFEKQTGIKVRAVYDSEAVKTVGLANRLIAERSHPQCDVFWNNEELRTRQLAAQNIFRETNGWAATAFRTRRIVFNTNFVGRAGLPLGQNATDARQRVPTSLLELTNANWRGKVALSYPLFGSTATHFLALRQRWGDAAWQNWCRALAANKPFLVDGNSVVVNLVARGEAWVGLTDSDDVLAGQREGLPIESAVLREDGLMINNTVAVVRDAPHPNNAQMLFEFLQSEKVYEQLKAAGAVEEKSARIKEAELFEPDWAALLRDLDSSTTELKEIFLR